MAALSLLTRREPAHSPPRALARGPRRVPVVSHASDGLTFCFVSLGFPLMSNDLTGPSQKWHVQAQSSHRLVLGSRVPIERMSSPPVPALPVSNKCPMSYSHPLQSPGQHQIRPSRERATRQGESEREREEQRVLALSSTRPSTPSHRRSRPPFPLARTTAGHDNQMVKQTSVNVSQSPSYEAKGPAQPHASTT